MLLSSRAHVKEARVQIQTLPSSPWMIYQTSLSFRRWFIIVPTFQKSGRIKASNTNNILKLL